MAYACSNRFSIKTSRHHPLHYAISCLKLIVFCMFGWKKTLIILVTTNLFYWLNIVGDHDQCQTLEAKYNGPNWLIRQIANSGDFIRSNSWWSCWFGGINHQIAHHLFPNYTNVSIPQISDQIRKFKLSQDLVFVEAKSLWSLIVSHLSR